MFLPETVFFAAFDGSEMVEIPVEADDEDTHWTVNIVQNLQGDALFPFSDEGFGSSTLNVYVGECLQEAFSHIGIIEISGQRAYIVQRDFQLWTDFATTNFPWQGGVGTINVETEDHDFDIWQTVSDSDWITIAEGQSGSGDGQIRFAVGENTTGKERRGRIIVSGEVCEIVQSAPGVLTGLEISGADSVLAGGTSHYEAFWFYSDGERRPAMVEWALPGSTYAQMSDDGMLTAGVSAGEVTINACGEMDGHLWRCAKTVQILGRPVSLEIVIGKKTVCVNDKVVLSLVVTYADGTFGSVASSPVKVEFGDAIASVDGVVTIGSHTGKVCVSTVYTQNGITVSANKEILVRDAVTCEEALGTGYYSVVNDSTDPWTVDTEVSHDGQFSMVSEGTDGPGNLTFRVRYAGDFSCWMKSVAADSAVPVGQVLVDGVVAATLCGNMDWTNIVAHIEKFTDHEIVVRRLAASGTSLWLDEVEWHEAPILPTAIVIPNDCQIVVGQETNCSCMVQYNNGTQVQVVPVWTIVSGESCVDIDPLGHLVGKEPGEAVVKAFYTEKGIAMEGTFSVKVVKGLSSLSINVKKTTVCIGDRVPLEFFVNCSDGTTEAVEPDSVRVESGDAVMVGKCLLEIGSQRGLVRVSSVYTQNGMTVSANKQIFVRDAVTCEEALGTSVFSVANGGDNPWVVDTEVSHDGQFSMVAGGTASDLKLSVNGAGIFSGWLKSVSSSEDVVGQVLVDGDVVATLLGNADWTNVVVRIESFTDHEIVIRRVSGSNNSASLWIDHITWSPIVRELASIAIDGTSQLAVGKSATLTCMATYADGGTSYVAPAWSIALGEERATIDASGILRATRGGEVVVKATYTENDIVKTATHSVSVTKEPTLIAITGPDQVYMDGSGQYCCVITYNDGSSEVVVPQWRIPEGAYASISKSGILSPGNAEESVSLVATFERDGKTLTESKPVQIVDRNRKIAFVVGSKSDMDNVNISLVTSVVVRASMKVIPSDSFAGWPRLLWADIEPGVEEIRARAFSGCPVLRTVTIPDSVVFVGMSAFQSCGELLRADLPEGIAEIRPLLFAECTNLVSTTIPSSVESIGDYAYIRCKNLTSLEIGPLVTNVGASAFEGCASLREVHFAGDAPVVANRIYAKTPETLTTFVKYGSRGWKEPGSTALPDKWPNVDSHARPIAYDSNAYSARWTPEAVSELSQWLTTHGLMADVGKAFSSPSPLGKRTAYGVPLSLVDEFVLGLDPFDPQSVFTVFIEMVDGRPVIGWRPNLNEKEIRRQYRVWGRTALGDAQGWIWPADFDENHFFMVSASMPEDGDGDSDVPGEIELSKLASVPMAVDGLVYDGTEKQGVLPGTGYVLSGATAREAGTYTAIATLKSGYAWDDGATGTSRTISWSIAKATNSWLTQPGLSSTEFTEGSTVTVSMGEPKFGSSQANYSASDIAKLGIGSYTLVFSVAGTDNYTGLSESIPFVVKEDFVEPSAAGLYCVVDLSGGPAAEQYPVSYLTAVPKGGWTDEYKTTKLVLRRIEPGTFTMGDQVHGGSTTPDVVIEKPYYIGVFEVTQRQWELVVGNRPSFFKNDDYYATRPVECVSWKTICIDSGNIVSLLQEKTGMDLNLPTAAQWEYACRAGTTTDYNSGKNYTSKSSDSNMDRVGRYLYNGGSLWSAACTTESGTAKVGSYARNAWGLYDMHGNVSEWCLDEDDWNYYLGGGWDSNAGECASFCRERTEPTFAEASRGLRISCSNYFAAAEPAEVVVGNGVYSSSSHE